MNLMPVGSAVTKTVRLGCNMVDVILNFNKPALINNQNVSEEVYEKKFIQTVEKVK